MRGGVPPEFELVLEDLLEGVSEDREDSESVGVCTIGRGAGGIEVSRMAVDTNTCARDDSFSFAFAFKFAFLVSSASRPIIFPEESPLQCWKCALLSVACVRPAPARQTGVRRTFDVDVQMHCMRLACHCKIFSTSNKQCKLVVLERTQARTLTRTQVGVANRDW